MVSRPRQDWAARRFHAFDLTTSPGFAAMTGRGPLAGDKEAAIFLEARRKPVLCFAHVQATSSRARPDGRGDALAVIAATTKAGSAEKRTVPCGAAERGQ